MIDFKKNDLAIDVGANIGEVSLILDKLLGVKRYL